MHGRAQSFYSVYFFSSGCLLPLLILGNFFLGWLFLKPLHWLLSEGILIVLFVLHTSILMRRSKAAYMQKNKVIEVRGEIIEENTILK